MTPTAAALEEPEASARAVIYLRVSTKEQAERGGEAEGFSIPAQREAAVRKAAAMGATVVGEYIDAGESARSAARPELQRMLRFLAEDQGVRYVIVHKVDRLARNRVDDVEINVAIQKAGATLVSCTENIDETPSGMLLHGIMSTIAEFYSRNLANEVIKGTEQKLRAGGTPMLAPIGYLNVRTVVDGREVRTIAVDQERAELVKWAFKEYALGNTSLSILAEALEARGLMQRATAKRAARPLAKKQLWAMLRNPYYTGVVTWRGIQFTGSHQALVDVSTFERVQDVLGAHGRSGERAYSSSNYLAGSLYCALCESKLVYSISTGSGGRRYAYWFCIGRHTYNNGCELPYLREDEVEQAVSRRWLDERFDEDTIEWLRSDLSTAMHSQARQDENEVAQLRRQVESIERERMKWAEKSMSGAVPDDIARDKQADLGRQLASSQTALTGQVRVTQDAEPRLKELMGLIEDCADVYQRAGEQVRRLYNQAWFQRLMISTHDDRPAVTAVERSELMQAVQTLSNPEETPDELPRADKPVEQKWSGSLHCRTIVPVLVSRVQSLVELRGLEPLTPTLPVWCATSCATAPYDPVWCVRAVVNHTARAGRSRPGGVGATRVSRPGRVRCRRRGPRATRPGRSARR